MIDDSKRRLGELLVEAGVLQSEQLGKALEIQKKRQLRLGTILLQEGFVTEPQLIQALSRRLSIPWVSLWHIDISEQLLSLVPAGLAEEFFLIPIYVRTSRSGEKTLYVAMNDPTDDAALRFVSASAGMSVKPMIAGPSDIAAAIRAYYFGEEDESITTDMPPPPVDPTRRPGMQPAAPRPASSSKPPLPPPPHLAPTRPAPDPLAFMDQANQQSKIESFFQGAPVDLDTSEEEPAAAAARLASARMIDTGSAVELASPLNEELDPDTLDEEAHETDELLGDDVMLATAAEDDEADDYGVEETGDYQTEDYAEDAEELEESEAPEDAADEAPPDEVEHAGGEPLPEVVNAGEPTALDESRKKELQREVERHMFGVGRSRPAAGLSLTLLDGTRIAFGGKARKRSPGTFTREDLIAGLRAAASGTPIDDFVPSTSWEAHMAALLEVLFRKHLVFFEEYMEELGKK